MNFFLSFIKYFNFSRLFFGCSKTFGDHQQCFFCFFKSHLWIIVGIDHRLRCCLSHFLANEPCCGNDHREASGRATGVGGDGGISRGGGSGSLGAYGESKAALNDAFRQRTSDWREAGVTAIVGFAVLLLFAYAISWVMAAVGLLVRTPEIVNNASFIVIFPVTFIANTFVPAENLPGPLRAFANWNPISAVTQAAREQFGNTSPALPPQDVWPMQHPVAYSLLWVALILAVFIPLSVRLYRRAASR